MSSKGAKQRRHTVLYNQSKRTPNASVMNYPKQPVIKWVRKASSFCKTWYEEDRNGKMIHKQAWYDNLSDAMKVEDGS